MKSRLSIRLLMKLGVWPIVRRTLRWSGVLCLNYHRIGEGGNSIYDRGLWSATSDGFDSQLSYFKSRYDIIRPIDLSDAVKSSRGRYLMITFDDGYLDNYEIAFPILSRHRVPATFFVTTGFIDRRKLSWWDEIAWMVRTSKRNGVELPDWLPAPIEFDEPHRDAAVRAL